MRMSFDNWKQIKDEETHLKKQLEEAVKRKVGEENDMKVQAKQEIQNLANSKYLEWKKKKRTEEIKKKRQRNREIQEKAHKEDLKKEQAQREYFEWLKDNLQKEHEKRQVRLIDKKDRETRRKIEDDIKKERKAKFEKEFVKYVQKRPKKTDNIAHQFSDFKRSSTPLLLAYSPNKNLKKEISVYLENSDPFSASHGSIKDSQGSVQESEASSQYEKPGTLNYDEYSEDYESDNSDF